MDIGIRPPGWAGHWATPGEVRGGVTHRVDAAPGWRCSCGSLRLPLCLPGEPRGGHVVVADELGPADADTCPGYLARFADVSAAGFEAVLARAQHPPVLVDALLRWTTGAAEDTAGAARVVALLCSAVPLTEAHLLALAARGESWGLPAARALLGHPACTARVVATLTTRLAKLDGRPRHVDAAAVLEALAADPRPRVAGLVALYRYSVVIWPGEDWADRRQAYVDAAAELEARHGNAGWPLLAALVEDWTGTGPQLLDAVTGVLAESSGGTAGGTASGGTGPCGR